MIKFAAWYADKTVNGYAGAKWTTWCSRYKPPPQGQPKKSKLSYLVDGSMFGTQPQPLAGITSLCSPEDEP